MIGEHVPAVDVGHDVGQHRALRQSVLMVCANLFWVKRFSI